MNNIPTKLIPDDVLRLLQLAKTHKRLETWHIIGEPPPKTIGALNAINSLAMKSRPLLGCEIMGWLERHSSTLAEYSVFWALTEAGNQVISD